MLGLRQQIPGSRVAAEIATALLVSGLQAQCLGYNIAENLPRARQNIPGVF